MIPSKGGAAKNTPVIGDGMEVVIDSEALQTLERIRKLLINAKLIDLIKVFSETLFTLASRTRLNAFDLQKEFLKEIEDLAKVEKLASDESTTEKNDDILIGYALSNFLKRRAALLRLVDKTPDPSNEELMIAFQNENDISKKCNIISNSINPKLEPLSTASVSANQSSTMSDVQSDSAAHGLPDEQAGQIFNFTEILNDSSPSADSDRNSPPVSASRPIDTSTTTNLPLTSSSSPVPSDPNQHRVWGANSVETQVNVSSAVDENVFASQLLEEIIIDENKKLCLQKQANLLAEARAFTNGTQQNLQQAQIVSVQINDEELSMPVSNAVQLHMINVAAQESVQNPINSAFIWKKTREQLDSPNLNEQEAYECYILCEQKAADLLHVAKNYTGNSQQEGQRQVVRFQTMDSILWAPLSIVVQLEMLMNAANESKNQPTHHVWKTTWAQLNTHTVSVTNYYYEFCKRRSDDIRNNVLIWLPIANVPSNTQSAQSTSNTSNAQPGQGANTQSGEGNSNTQSAQTTSNAQPEQGANTQSGEGNSNTQSAQTTSNTQPAQGTSNYEGILDRTSLITFVENKVTRNINVPNRILDNLNILRNAIQVSDRDPNHMVWQYAWQQLTRLDEQELKFRKDNAVAINNKEFPEYPAAGSRLPYVPTDFLERCKVGCNDYTTSLNDPNKSKGFWPFSLFRTSSDVKKARAKKYQDLLENPVISDLQKKIVIYSLLSSKNKTSLQEHVYKNLGYTSLEEAITAFKKDFCLILSLRIDVNAHVLGFSVSTEDAEQKARRSALNNAIDDMVSYAEGKKNRENKFITEAPLETLNAVNPIRPQNSHAI